MILFSHETHTSLKNHLTASMFGLTGASVLLLMLGLCMWPFPEKLTLAMYPVPNFDFSLIDVPMHRSFPFAIIAIRSPRISASSMEWVVKTIALPFLASSMMSQTCLLVIGSMPVVYKAIHLVRLTCDRATRESKDQNNENFSISSQVHREKPILGHQSVRSQHLAGASFLRCSCLLEH